MQEQNDQNSSKTPLIKDENTEENSEASSLFAQRSRRNELYDKNSKAWSNKLELNNLDSNLKKHTSFIKKMKTHLNSENCTSLLNEIKTLKLEKYLSEIIVSLNEGILKCKTTANVNAAVDIVSALHQRFTESFTPELINTIKQNLVPPSKSSNINSTDKEKEDTARIAKHKVLLRIITEFWLVGLLNDNVGHGLNPLKEEINSSLNKSNHKVNINCPIYDISKDLLIYDQDTSLGLSLAISFVKQFGIDILGTIPTNSTLNSECFESQNNQSALITPEVQNAFKKLFESYYNRASKRIINEHKKIQKIEKSNEEQYINRGELTENSKQYFEKAFKAYEKDLSLVNSLAELLNLPQPKLPEDESIPAQSDLIVTNGDPSRSSLQKLIPTDLGPWDDEESKSFYTDILDIKLMVPGMLLEGGSKSVKTSNFVDDKQDESEMDNIESDSKSGNTYIAQSDKNTDPVIQNTDLKNESSNDANSSNNQPSSPLLTTSNAKSAQLETLILKLSNMANRDLINEIAVEFCYINTKPNRTRLIQALFGVHRLRLDLIPYYSRLLATLNPYFPEITQGVLSSLANEFKGFRRKKYTGTGHDFRESRIKNIRYISELTKFGLAPSHDIFHCFKILLDDMNNPSSLETLCSMLDCCGRFLYKNLETFERTNVMLEQLIKKKNSMALDPRLNTMIENAYYQVNPPDQPAIKAKVRTEVELFLIHLINEQLDYRSAERILKIIRRFNWDDPKVYKFIFKIFTKIWKYKDSTIPLIAILLSGLQAIHHDFVVEVLDQVFEDIIIGLELNDYRYNQRRIYLMRYLGELLNYKVLDSSIIFETLYTIITFGHDNGLPRLGSISPIDLPDDFFRIRLVNTLLETCGNNLKIKKEAPRLKNFIIFFQMYIFTKLELPLEIEFAVSDLFDKLNMNSLRSNNYEEAYHQVNQIIIQEQESLQQLSSQSFNELEHNSKHGDINSESQDYEILSSQNSPTLNLSSDVEDLDLVNDSLSDDDSEDDINNQSDQEDEDSEHGEVDEETEDDDIDEYDVIDDDEDMERRLKEEEDEEFDREFNFMMAQSLDSRKYDRKAKLIDIQLPTRLGELKTAKIDPSQNKVAFTVLTKKIGKGQAISAASSSSKVLEVPSECSLALNTLNRQERERQEQIQLKKMVLGFEEQQDLEERKDFQQTLAKQGVYLTNSTFRPLNPSLDGQSHSNSSPSSRNRGNRNIKKF